MYPFRFKADMWAKIAEEMTLPWRAAEAMHWQMGEHEMARRAGVTAFSLSNNQQQQHQAMPPHTSSIPPRAHMRHNSAISRMRDHNTNTNSLLPAHRNPPPQLPSLAELTAGLPAYAASSSTSQPGTPYHHPDLRSPSQIPTQMYNYHQQQHAPRR